ncbi:MAG: SurA N-terminal domain-containing protein, partial [Bacteroidetes bacterium]|nr:SurA N-terminal domain-containing protein [Bacteroidota bacterium]
MKQIRIRWALPAILLALTYSSFAQVQHDTIVEGIVAIVGGNVILKSDIENQYIQIRSQGNIQGTATSLKCQILENLLFQKLLLHQSQVDSLTVTDAQVENEMDRRMRYFISQA